MRTRLTSRPSLLFLAFAVMLSVMALVSGFAVKANAQEAASPTISSDQADYPPGGNVILTGSGWQPGESVNIFVNDDVGKTWSRNVDVTADESGAIRDEFQLPNWFVATYSVKATGAQSGAATTSFTDSAAQIQGQSNPACTSGGGCESGWEAGNLKGWQELDNIPLRLKFPSTGTFTVNVDFDHFQTSSNSPGIQDLHSWTEGSGLTLQGQPSLTTGLSGGKWRYTVTAKVTSPNSFLFFKGNLAAGAHNFTGSSLALSGNEIGGTLQITQPKAKTTSTPDLVIDKTGPTSAGQDQVVTYTLNYQNKSTATAGDATGVQLTDVLPSGVTYVAGSCSGTCSVAGNEVVWNLGTLAKGASGSRTLQVRIPADAAFGTNYTDTARIRSAENDQNMADNDDALTTTVSFNRSPNAVNDSLTTNEDNAESVNVLANDTDPDGDTLTVTGNTSPQNGSVMRNGGSFTYTPNKDFNGSDSFTYTISDGKGGTATGTVNVTANPVNDAPKANADAYEVNEDQTLTVAATDGVLKNDTDVENNPLTAVKVSEPTKGTLTLNANGSITYAPNKDFNGTDSFTYKANDGSTDSNVATVTITVKAVNDAPVAQDDSATTDEDKVIVSIPVLTNDSDVDGDGLNVSSFDATSAQGGTVSKNEDGTLRYQPAANFNGTDSFTYTLSDGKGGSATAKVTITVDAVNDAPSFTKGNDHTVNEDAGVQTVNDWASAISAGPNESAQNVSFVVTNDNNSLFSAQPAVASNGTLTYTPDTDKNGSATVTVKTKDDGGTPDNPGDDLTSGEQTFTITVRPVNDAPSFKIGADQTVNEDAGAQTVPGFATEISKGPADEPGQSLTFIRTSNTNSALFSAQPEISANGTLTYTLADNANGEATVSFKIQDSGGTDNGGVDESAAQSFKITVRAVNDAPVAADDSAETDEDNAITSIEVLKNDSDVEGDTLSVSETTQPTNGTVTINEYGTLRYQPAANFNGTDSFTYTVSDGKGGTDTAKVTITVNAVNDAPVAKELTGDNNQVRTPEDTRKNITLEASDVDSNNLTFTIVGEPTHGTLSDSGANLTYTPNKDFNGSDSFTFKVCDDSTPEPLCDEGRIDILVTAVNDDPVAKADEYTISEDGALTVGEDQGVLNNDSDVDAGDKLTATLKSGPANGTLTLNPDGSFTYTPKANFNGEDSFTYTVSDGNDGTADATVTVTITAVNDKPVANGDSAETDEDTATDINVLANDSDVDEGDTLSIEKISQPANGKAEIVDGKVLYTPNADFNGTDSFTYKAKDAAGAESNAATVTIKVNAVNDAPVISKVAADPTSVNEGSPATITVTATDPDNQATDLRYSFDCDNANGFEKGPQAADNATCTFDDNGTYRVNVRVTDGSVGGSATGFTDVIVTNVAPTLTGDITISPQRALVGQNVTFTAPNPSDPSQADRNAGFTWNWYANNMLTPFMTGLNLNPLVTNKFSSNKCGTYSVSAAATDKDKGVSNVAKANASVNVSDGHFRAPLVDGTANLVQKGQVVPVKIFVGCGTTTLTGLTPSIQLLKGNVTPEDETQYTTLTASVSSADTEGWMRAIDGSYIYNLRVPDAAVGTEFTIRVNPFGTTATPNPAGSQMYSLIKIRK